MANAISSLNIDNKLCSFTLPYGVCSTAADTAAKTVTVPNFSLEAGATVIVKFTNANSVASPTLNVNGTGAKSIMRYGTTATSTGTTTTGWVAGAVQMFTYDGTNWIRDYWNNTTYSTFKASGSTAASGLVPKPSTTAGTIKYLREDGTWRVPPDTNTKVTNTLATTTKAYVTGTTSATTNTGTQVFDTGVYLDTTAGRLTADSLVAVDGAYVGDYGALYESGNFTYITGSSADEGIRIGDDTSYTNGAIVGVYDKNTQTYKEVSTVGHTHNYAGSSSAGGSATSAVKLDTATAGSATQPAYFSGGKPIACTYTLEKSVPSNAVFTDTNTKVTQAAAITTNGDYPIILGYSTATTAVTNTVNKASALTYNPSTHSLNVNSPSGGGAVNVGQSSFEDKGNFLYISGGTDGTVLKIGDGSLTVNNTAVSMSGHTHNYAGSSSAGGAATSANKVNANLAIKLNGGTTEGTNLFTFNGSAAKTVNITPSNIGAAASSHTHNAITNTTKTSTSSAYDVKLYYDNGYYFLRPDVTDNCVLGSSGYSWYKVWTTNLRAGGEVSIGGITTISSRIQPATDKAVQLGTSSLRWLNVYCQTASMNTSDRKEKKNIELIDDRYIQLFDLLEPVAYQFIDGTSGRTHTGFIAQDVEDAMAKVGLKSTDLAFFCKDIKTESVFDENGHHIGDKEVYDEDGNPVYVYSLRYPEYIAIMAEKIKRMESQYNSKIEELEKRLEALGV